MAALAVITVTMVGFFGTLTFGSKTENTYAADMISSDSLVVNPVYFCYYVIVATLAVIQGQKLLEEDKENY